MARCIILAPLYAGEELEVVRPQEGDILLCADGGWVKAKQFGLRPALVVGDFDSMSPLTEVDAPVLRLPREKDDTDLAVCLHEGRKRGYIEFVLAGCLGGRFDHTFSVLQCMADCAMRGEKALVLDKQNRVMILAPGAYTLPQMPGRKLSLLAYSPKVEDVCITGTKWPLQHAVLTANRPLGCSNEFVAETAELSFGTGLLMVCYSTDLPFVEM